MRYKYGDKEVEIVDVEELKGKVVTVHEPKKFKYPEPFHCKFTLVGSNPEYSMFLTFYEAFDDKKFIFIEYLIRYMDKDNIVDVDELFNSEIELIKSDYNNCPECAS